jgi:competence ComEA-like helix-hairpin-helix protein
MKSLLKLAIGLLIAYLVYRLLTEYLRPTRVRLEEQLVTAPPYHKPAPVSPPSPPPSPAEPDRLNLNQADIAALTELPGIGPTLAGRIVEHRQQVGSFVSLDDLTQIQGIGSALVEQLRGLVKPS